MSKLTGHGLGRGPSQAIIDAGAVGAKWVNADPPPNLPDNFTAIWRWVRQGDILNDWLPNRSPEQAAQDWVNEQWPHIQFVPKTAFIEGQNEPNVKTVAQADWFWRYELKRMQLMDALGYRCVIGNFAKGNPSVPLIDADGAAAWTPALPALRYAAAHGHLLGMHAYGPQTAPLDPFVMVRHRSLYPWLPADARPKLAITEWGLDTTLGRFREPGWRNSVSDPDATYLAMMQAYDQGVAQDEYLILFCVFTEGVNNDEITWGPFDIANQPIERMMADYIRAGVAGEPTMAKFNQGQTVYVTNPVGVNLLNANGDKIDAASWGDHGVVQTGPTTIKGAQRWQVQITGKQLGWIDETFLDTHAPTPTPVGMGRVMKLKVDDHQTPRYVRTGPARSYPTLNFEQGSGIGNRIDWTNSYFEMDGFQWSPADNDWWLHISNGHGVFGGQGWVEYYLEGTRHEPLAVYDSGPGVVSGHLDGKGMPDWTKPPVVVTPPPTIPPEVPPVTTNWPEPPAIPAGVDLLGGKTFEDGWTTDGKGNQVPKDHGLEYTDHSGQPMPYPTKHADSADGRTTVVIPATAMGWGEYIHKANSGNNSVPDNEKKGAVREIVLDGEFAYKEMGNIAQAATIRRTVKGTPGQTATLVVHVSAESQDTPQSRAHPGRLEDDHMLVGLKWGALPEEVRNYAYMQTRRDMRLADGTVVDRPWNRLVQTTVFPASGELEYVLTCQNNWPRTFPQGGNDFFVDKIMVIVNDAPPPPPLGLPAIGTAYTEAQQNAVLDALRVKAGV